MKLIERSDLLDDLFASSANIFGADLEAYRNHTYRVLNFASALAPETPETSRKLEIASFFHDLGLWTDDTLDYLEPSARRAREYVEAQGLADWSGEVARMISEHHKITPAAGSGPLVEAFRKADWTDVTLGTVCFGLPRSFVSEVRSAFPNRGFHRRLVALTLHWLPRHPLSPLPMFKW